MLVGVAAWVLFLSGQSLVHVWTDHGPVEGAVYTACLAVSVCALLAAWAWRFRFGLRSPIVALLLCAQLGTVVLSMAVVHTDVIPPLTILFGWTLFIRLPTLKGWWAYLAVSAVTVVVEVADLQKQHPETLAQNSAASVIIVVAMHSFGYVALGAMIWCVLRLVAISDQLREANAENRRLAVTETRSKLMRDLHDTLGNRFAVIVTLGTLVERIAAKDPEQASAEAKEIQRQAMAAAAEMRLLTHAHRKPDFRRDLPRCAEMLRAAEIECKPRVLNQITDHTAELAGWALLEAVTNIRRHSLATQCSITLTREGRWHRLAIENDGVTEDVHTGGSGLDGLRERLAEAGGRLEAGADSDGWFRLVVWLPAQIEERRAA